MRKLRVVKGKSNRKKLLRIEQEQAKNGQFVWPDGQPIDPEDMLLSLLLPSAVKEVFRELEQEVEMLCGQRHSRGSEFVRWGSQGGSVFLGRQQVAIERPRVRSLPNNREQTLSTYQRFQNPTGFQAQVFRDGLRHISQRDYEGGAEKIGGAFGFKKSTVSKHWKRATIKSLSELQNRDLKPLQIKAVFIDGKRFGSLGVVVALGVAEGGKKYTLGIYQANTENGASCLALLSDLERRGLPSHGILFVVDGGSGLNSALEQKYAIHDDSRRTALRIRCYCHKWRNLEDILGKNSSAALEAAALFWAMRDAKDLTEAKALAASLERILKKANISALRSFQEAKPDLLMIHCLGLSTSLKRFFSSTNPIESLNSLLEEDLRRVKRWRDSEHFQRWLATAALSNEKRMHRVKGFAGLKLLSAAISKLCAKPIIDLNRKAA
jgi:transposase-like protein